MDLKPLILSLALIPAAGRAEPLPLTPYNFEEAQQRLMDEGMDGKVEPGYVAPEYGTRTDIYLMDDGEIQIQEHMANDEDDEVRVYDYDLDDGDAYDE